MKKIFYAIVALGLSLCLASCDKLFDNLEGDLSKMSAEDMYSSVAGLDRLMAALYASLPMGSFSNNWENTEDATGNHSNSYGGGINGFWNYTIGQRKGLGIAAREPLYVVRLDACRNEVVVGAKDELVRTEFRVTDMQWGMFAPREDRAPARPQPIPCRVKIRSTGEPRGPATFGTYPSGEVVCRMPSGLTGVTPGQSAVFYEADGDAILCGGVIAT